MTDADTVRVAALFHYDMTGNRDALAALDRLETERDALKVACKGVKELVAERDRLRAELDAVRDGFGG